MGGGGESYKGKGYKGRLRIIIKDTDSKIIFIILYSAVSYMQSFYAKNTLFDL